MLNSKGKRELCYLVQIDKIEPIQGAERVEAAVVGGWRVMVRKGDFEVGDTAIYFEIDSKVPEKEPFMFLAPKHFKIKSQRYLKGAIISQGLLMTLANFGWTETSPGIVLDNHNQKHILTDDSRFLTEELEVTYSVANDNKRKADYDKYKVMAQRNSKIFKHYPFRTLMKYTWGKKLLFTFFGKKKDNAKGFPTQFPYVRKTDQERCENMTWVLNDKTPFIKTEKCDGSSGTFLLVRNHKLFKPKYEFYVCSRNVRQLNPSQDCYYEKNYYWECAKKYDIENKLKSYLEKHPNVDYICWQGEICAPSIQGNPHKLSDVHLFLFHMITSDVGFWDILDAVKIWKDFDMETVPIVDTHYILPDDFEEFKLDADGYYTPSVCEGNSQCMREGYVYYKTDDPTFSFKNVSRKYLLKHHQ